MSVMKKLPGVGFAARTVTIFLLLGLAEIAAASCLSYGHSCWGAHGKRSGGRSQAQLIVPENSEETIATLTNPEDTRWFVSRLIGSAKNNNIWRTADDTDILEAEQRAGDEAVVMPQQMVEFPSQEDIENPSGDVVLMAAAPEEQASRSRAHKLRLYNIMNNSARKLD